MAKWDITKAKCPNCEETFQMYVDANEARIDAEAENVQLKQMWWDAGDVTDLAGTIADLQAKLTQQDDDDDFHPATAGDDPIWLGGVEYITKSRSDDLVQAAVVAALTEADQAIQSVAANCTTEDGHVAIVAAVEKVRSLIPEDAQAALDRVVAAERERCARVAESVALPMDGRNAKAQADYMSKVIARVIREGGATFP